jgi:hypothetical protein
VKHTQLEASADQLRIEHESLRHRFDRLRRLTLGCEDGAANMVGVAVLGITLNSALQQFQGVFVPPASHRPYCEMREFCRVQIGAGMGSLLGH